MISSMRRLLALVLLAGCASEGDGLGIGEGDGGSSGKPGPDAGIADGGTVQKPDGGEELCPGTGLTYSGDLTISAPEDLALLGQVVEVGGDLRIALDEEIDVVVPRLEVVGGGISVSSSDITRLSMPCLARAGEIDLTYDRRLVELAFESLEQIEEDLSLRNLPVETLSGVFPVLAKLDTLSIESTSLIDIDALEALTDLRVLVLTDNEALERVDGFPPVEVEYLYVHDNPRLVTLEGLRPAAAAGEISIAGNARLARVDPVGTVETVDALLVGGNPALAALPPLSLTQATEVDLEDLPLESLAPLSQLEHLDALRLADLPLSTLDGLDGITTLGDLSLDGLHLLTSLSGLRLRRVSGDVLIHDCGALVGLGGWEDLVGVGGKLELNDLPSLTSLGALGSLASVDGTLALRNLPSLVTLDGLDGLVHTRSVRLEELPSLTTLSGLSGLVSVDYGLFISDANALADLTGLDALRSAATLEVDGAPSFVSFGPLPSLTDVGTVRISRGALQDLAGLDGVTNLERLEIREQGALVNLAGLESLGSVDYLEIELNPALVSTADLSALQAVRSLSIRSNAALMELGLDALSMVGDLSITDNPNLPECQAVALKDRLSATGALGSVTISGNDPTGTCP